jgi:hypothetical protein
MYTLEDLRTAQRRLGLSESLVDRITNLDNEGLRNAYMHDPEVHAVVYLAIRIRHDLLAGSQAPGGKESRS